MKTSIHPSIIYRAKEKAMNRSKTVEDYIKAHPQWKSEINQLRAIVAKTELEETIKWGAPTYTINNKNVVGVGAFKSYVGLWFFNGVLLKDKQNRLYNAQEGKTKAMRQWRFASAEEIKEKEVLSYLKEAIELQKAGKVVAKAAAKTALEIPSELQSALDADAKLAEQFAAFTPYKQKEFAEHIGSAKREATRVTRLEKCIPMILQGVGLHDKYRNC